MFGLLPPNLFCFFFVSEDWNTQRNQGWNFLFACATRKKSSQPESKFTLPAKGILDFAKPKTDNQTYDTLKFQTLPSTKTDTSFAVCLLLIIFARIGQWFLN